MICFYCKKEFSLSGKQGGQNRQFCFDCIPEGLEKKDQLQIRRKLITNLANKQKIEMGCSKCGYNKCPQALEWHHKNDNKNFNPSDMIKDGSIKKYELYQAEIKKCVLLCSNCHREEHYIEYVV